MLLSCSYCIKAKALQVLMHASRSQARMSSPKPTNPELRYRGDVQKPVNWTQSKCEEIPPNYTENQTNTTNPTSEQSQDKENTGNNAQQPENNMQENNVQKSEPLCDCKTIAILMLIVVLVVTTMLSTLPLYSPASCEQQVELTVTKYELLIQTKSAEYERQMAQLQVDLKGLKHENTRLESKVKELEKDKNQLATDWQLSKQMVDEKSRAVTALEGEKKQLELAKVHLQAEKTQLEKDVGKLTVELQDIKGELVKKTEQSKLTEGEKSKAVTTLEGEKKQLELAKVQLQADKTQLEKDNDKMVVELQDVKGELVKKTEAATTLEAEKWKIELETQKKAAENAAEQNKAFAEKDREYHELNSEVKVLQNEKSNVLEENKKLEVDLTRTTSSLENLNQEHRRVEKELQQYKQSYSEKFWERFEVGLDRDGERLSTLMKENTQLKNAVTQAKNEIIKTDSECTGLVCQALTAGIKSFFG